MSSFLEDTVNITDFYSNRDTIGLFGFGAGASLYSQISFDVLCTVWLDASV